MATIAIKLDTQKLTKRLKEAGFKASQAEAVVEVLRENGDATEEALGILATKSDLVEVKYDILKWTIPLILGLYALIIFKLV